MSPSSEPPLISVVVATRNAAAALPGCLESLRGQSFQGFETVVMDGASTDETVALLKGSGDVVTAWRSEPDHGIYSAWNKALGLAHGEWICFLGADDRLCGPHAFERLVAPLRSALPRYRVVYSRVRQLDAAGAVVNELGLPWDRAMKRFRSYECLPHPGLMHHRSLFEVHGRFDERFRFAADYEFLLRELKLRDALFVPQVTVAASYGGLTARPENFLGTLREVRLALAAHGLAPPRLLWLFWSACAWMYLRARALLGDRPARKLADLYRLLTLRAPRYSRSAERASGRTKPD